MVDPIFEGGGPGLIGGALFAFQIYADFSGYSDMAIGLGRLLGFDLRPNFQTPYFAKDLREFWQRWHISLSTWFRDYVYIPLGGNRGGQWGGNVFLTFLLSGLWHGANATFVLWGALHGGALILQRFFKFKGKNLLHWAINFLLVILLWIPFRAASLSQTFELYASLFERASYSWGTLLEVLEPIPYIKRWGLAVIGGLFLLIEFQMQRLDMNEWMKGLPKWGRWALYYGLIICILLLGNFQVKPAFIYFQF